MALRDEHGTYVLFFLLMINGCTFTGCTPVFPSMLISDIHILFFICWRTIYNNHDTLIEIHILLRGKMNREKIVSSVHTQLFFLKSYSPILAF
jgi:hypothetical protein